ncbi:uncharacterized protein EV422DRAFT_244119 [Fimicolochytrium jonesii]|uniref:uncharacterized protein n=1 Tax=Fimicolochytrium jonesii TaxID=1396493 RepID=UPI0022FE4F61|nr:uncharacterized protein EV422DRAFT_244119 [Fimicolochytrium jonesii]KAI8825069.1 hypothetical protein EV422DRAFT_244119 [Fimicolochytrium jonesii]
MKSFTLLLALVAAVSAQTCAPANYELCKSNAVDFEKSTCGPLATGPAANATLNTACLCYAAVNRVNCYAQCQGNQTVTDELNSVALPSQTARCTAANLNPAALPQPAPWVKLPLTTSSAVVASPTSTASQTAVATSSASAASSTATPTGTSAKNGAAEVAVGGVSAFAAAVAAVFFST